jgi:predicted nucleic acid-binding protein
MPANGLAYVDASALVKMVTQEPEVEALDKALDDWSGWVSSAIVEVEMLIASRRRSPNAVDAARVLLPLVELIGLDASIRRTATGLADPGLRTLDAIHVATALSLGERCGAFFAYDERMIAAARAHGLPVTVPGP